MKNKLLSILLTICMVALLLPVSVIPAYAESEVTKTFSFSTAKVSNDYLSIKATDPDDNTEKAILTVNGTMMDVFLNSSSAAFEIQNVTSAVSGTGNEVQLFISPYVDGKVTKVEFTKAGRGIQQEGSTFSMSIDGMKYNGTDDALTGVGASGESTSFTFISTDAAGIAGNLTMRLGVDAKFIINKSAGCQMIITYIPSAAPTHSHDFTFNAVGNTLTATCGHSDGLDCSLADAGYEATLTLEPPIYTYYRPNSTYSASHNLPAFNTQTGLSATTDGIRYTTDGNNYTADAPNAVGDYTARLIVTIGSTNYTLTQSFRVAAYSDINNIYPQFNVSTDAYASTTMAGEGQTVTITFTPKFGETLTGLTVTGATTNYSLSSGITDNNDNTYTFTMPGEDVNIGATFSISENDFAETDTDEYTIKTANGWGWFCFTVNSDLAPNGYSGKTVVLAASVGSSEMAGTSDHPFKGTFDGQGNTLTFSLQASEGYSAPFHYTNGATIRNLRVEGTITGGDNTSLGGLVGKATGNITIENCRVSTEISTTHSGAAWHGGVIALWYDSNVACTVTGCVYDGLIYNPSEADATTYCSGFIGNLFGSNLTVTFTDCLYAPAAYGTGEYAPGDNCYTFVYPNSSPTYNMTNCYYTTALGKRQGRPAATATDAPANLGDATTDHGLVKGYANGFLYNGNYYTPKYGDVVVEYVFNALWEHADVTINGQGDNLVGVNITEEVGNVTSVTYNRTFTSGVAAAVILPFDYTCNGNEGGSFYSFAGVSGTTPVMEDGNHVTSLTANTPYLFVPTATVMTFPNISNMTGGVVTLKPTAGDHTVTSGDWTLTGIYAPKTWTGIEPDYDNAFILNSIGKLNHISFDEMVKPTDGYFVGSVITYTVTFDANGGTGTIAAETVNSGATYTLPACTFTAPEGKTFFAWSVKIGDVEAVNKQPGDTITVTADTTVTATWEWRLQDGFYLIGPDWTYGAIDAGDRFEGNPGNGNEYMLRTALSAGDEIKVVRVENNAIAEWFPDGLDNQYHVDAAHAGDVNIYFQTEYNSAWSEFGGYFYIEAVTEPSFKTHSLVLSGRIGVNFFMDLPTIEGVDYAESYMTFEISGKGTVPADPVPFDPTHTNAKSTYYSFTCYVNSIQMADTITATFHYGDGLTVSETYSIRQYIASFDAYLAAHPGAYDDVTVNLVHALADYGHFVQPFLSAARGWTIGSGDDQYAEMDTVYTTEYNINAVKTAVADYGIQRTMSADIAGISYSLLMDSDTAIYLYFKPIADYDGGFTVDGYTATKQKDGRYLVKIPNIGAHKLGDPYTVVVTTTNGESTVKVSALSYVKGILNAEAYQDNSAAQYAAASIYHYYAAAAAYKTIHP